MSGFESLGSGALSSRGLVSVLVPLVALGCAGEGNLIAFDDSIPDEVAWLVAALVSDNETEATGLLSRTDGVFQGELGRDVSSGTLWVLGYTDDEIRALAQADPSSLSNAPLRAAGSTESALPVGAWRARGPWAEPTIALDSPSAEEAPPRLVADWLPLCPSLVTEQTRVRVVGIDPCGAVATQVGCRLELNLGICGVGVAGEIVGGGVTVLEGTGEYLRCESEPETPRSFECSLRGDRTDRIELVESLPPRFAVDRFTVSAETYEPLSNQGYPFGAGTVHGPALVGDRVVVSRTEGAAQSCETSAPASDLVFVDPSDGSITHTATAPTCLILLESEPERATFLGFSGRFGAPSVHRFDRAGRVLRSVTLAATSPEVPTIDSARVVGDRVIIVLRFFLAASPEPPAELIVLDRASLEELFRKGGLARPPHRPFSTDDALGVMGGSLIRFLDRDSGEDIDQWSTSRSLEGCLPGLVMATEWDPASRRLLSTEQRDLHRVLVVQKESCHSIASHEWAAAPLDMLPTHEPNVWLVSVNGNDRISRGIHDNTGVGEVDLEPMRFRPGVLRFGRGPLRGLIEDQNGDVWATLQWTGELVRIRRAP